MDELEIVKNEKMYDSGANTIEREMEKLKNSFAESNDISKSRWAWELVQNAFDCRNSPELIEMKIEYKGNLKFSHNGLPFTYGNLIDLVTQISSKQSQNEKVGKFGTGFIATHIVSKKVKIQGMLKKENEDLKYFEFVLDRSNTEYKVIRENIKSNIEKIDEIYKSNIGDEIYESNIGDEIYKNNIVDEIYKNNIVDERKVDTTFEYINENNCISKDVVELGLSSLLSHMPFVLAFNEGIKSIICNECIVEIKNEKILIEGFKVFTIVVENKYMEVLCLTDQDVSIAIYVKPIENEKYEFLQIPNNISKVFCNFPLTGSETFAFPMIVNSSKFKIEMDRNGILSSAKENIRIIEKAEGLIFKLINYAVDNDWKCIYNLLNCGSGDMEIEKNFISRFKEKIARIEMIECISRKNEIVKESFENSEKKPLVLLTKTKKEENIDILWDIMSDFKGFTIPTKESNRGWAGVFDKKYEVLQILEYIITKNNNYLDIEELKTRFSNKSECMYDILSRMYNLYILDNSVDDFKRNVRVLNQKGDFIEVSKVFIDDEIDKELKEIQNELCDISNEKDSFKNILLDKNLRLDAPVFEKKGNIDISNNVKEKVNKILSSETMNNDTRNQDVQSVFRKLEIWFRQYPEKSKELFGSLYDKRSMLSSVEENIKRIKISDSMEKHNVDVEQLDDIIGKHNIIDEILNNFNAMDKNEIIEKLKHNKTSSQYYKEKFDEMLERTIIDVYNYLQESSKYTVSDTLEEWKNKKLSQSIFSAKFNESDIQIVIRPSDGDKIIIFSKDEFETLDSNSYQLWTSNEKNEIREITLGDILKTTGISVIPLHNLFKEK